MRDLLSQERAITDREWLRRHLQEERRRTELLGEIREALFGIQDGLTTTLVIVSAVGGATGERFPVIVAGVAGALAGMFAMGVGEYTGSKAVREIHEHEIADERAEVRERPDEAVAEVAYLLEEEGLSPERARRVAGELATNQNVLLRTMVEKEHGIAVDIGAPPLQGAVVMGAAFGVGALPPLLPYLFLPVGVAVFPSLALSALAVFAIGVVKARWTRQNPVRSGLELLVLTAFAGVAGYFFGSLLPALFGVAVGV